MQALGLPRNRELGTISDGMLVEGQADVEVLVRCALISTSNHLRYIK